MVKLMMGLKGSGKTKQMIEMVRAAESEEAGAVVCIEKGTKLTHDIPHTVRLIDTSSFNISDYEFMKGFICGIFSNNFDITHIFIDSLTKIIGVNYDEKTEDFLVWCDKFSQRENVKFTILISADVNLASENVKKYL